MVLKPEVGLLSIVPTPIGNRGDMTARAIEALKSCDVVCAEDTRVTAKLLGLLDIKKPLARLDENLIVREGHKIIERVRAGEHVCYCSDAGMPGVSDPGVRLVALAHDAGVPVEVLPGPTAVETAFVYAGFMSTAFYFGGFFPRKSSEARTLLEKLSALECPLVFYESPYRIADTLRLLAEMMPSRRLCVCRELTKLHEEVIRERAVVLAEEFAQRAAAGQIKGEFVFVIDVPDEQERAESHAQTRDDARDVARELLVRGDASNKDIVRELRQRFNISKNDAYELVLALKDESES